VRGTKRVEVKHGADDSFPAAEVKRKKNISETSCPIKKKGTRVVVISVE
jgi:hypothetical protein